MQRCVYVRACIDVSESGVGNAVGHDIACGEDIAAPSHTDRVTRGGSDGWEIDGGQHAATRGTDHHFAAWNRSLIYIKCIYRHKTRHRTRGQRSPRRKMFIKERCVVCWQRTTALMTRRGGSAACQHHVDRCLGHRFLK